MMGRTWIIWITLAAPLGAQVPGLKPAELEELYQRGQFRKVDEELSAAIAKTPGDAALLWFSGRTHLKLQKWDEAVKDLEKAVEIEPSSSLYHLWLGRAYGEKASRASIFRALSWAGKVRKAFEKAVELDPGNLDARFDLLEYYLQAPGLAGGGRDKAETQVREIETRSPQLGCAARARLREEDKRWDLARKELTDGIARYPESLALRSDLAWFLLRRDLNPEAEAAARDALRLDASLPSARLALAAALVKQKKDPDQALAITGGLARGPLKDEDPGFAEVYFWQGRSYLLKGDKVLAQKAFQMALSFQSDYPEAKEALKQAR